MPSSVRSIAAAAAVLFCSISYGTVFYVHPDSTQDSIQPCLDMCSTGDTVLVGAGTYTENIHWPVPSGIKLLSEHGRDTTIIDGGGSARVVMFPDPVDTTTVIRGFTLRGGYATYGGGIMCDTNASPLILDNLITLNTAYGTEFGHGGGIALSYDASPIIRGNIISRNHAAGSWSGGGGIFLTGGCAPVIENNTIEGNSSTAAGGGIMCFDHSAATITGNIVRYDTAGPGSAGGGICSQRASTVIYGNTIANNYAPLGGGLDSGQDDSSSVCGNTIESNASYSDGGGISCGNGNALIDSNDIRLNHAQGSGGGIVCKISGTAPTISRNTFYGNSCDACGGGIQCWESDAVISGNEIDSNYAVVAGGGIWCEACSPTITGNTITRNSVTGSSPIYAGGGIIIRVNSHPLVEDNDIKYNTAPSGGGIGCYRNSNPQILRNRIIGNSVDSIGGGLDIYNNSSPTLRGNVVDSNQAVLGGGLSCWEQCLPEIESCDIRDNTGDGVRCEQASSPIIRDCNIVGNSHYGVRNMDSTLTVVAEYNWWGDSTGPYHPTLNPMGLGDTVSDYVDFIPWIGSGIADKRLRHESSLSVSATVLRGVLRMPGKEPAELLDATGRAIMELRPGGNDIRRVAPGIYFVRRPETEDGRPRTAVRKVVVQR